MFPAPIFVTVLVCFGTMMRAGEAAEPTREVKDLAWLAEAWSSEQAGEVIDEHWMPPRGGIMLGMNRTARTNGKTSFEFMRIAETKTGLVFYASPSGKPATPFQILESAPTRIVFENKTNDFPQRIIYERIDDTLHARIEGNVGGKLESLEWKWGLARTTVQ